MYVIYTDYGLLDFGLRIDQDLCKPNLDKQVRALAGNGVELTHYFLSQV